MKPHILSPNNLNFQRKIIKISWISKYRCFTVKTIFHSNFSSSNAKLLIGCENWRCIKQRPSTFALLLFLHVGNAGWKLHIPTVVRFAKFAVIFSRITGLCLMLPVPSGSSLFILLRTDASSDIISRSTCNRRGVEPFWNERSLTSLSYVKFVRYIYTCAAS